MRSLLCRSTVPVAFALLAAAVGCGQGPSQRMSTYYLAPRSGQGVGTGLDATATPPCAAGTHRYELAAGSTVSWVVVKADGTPVVGVHPVSGGVELVGAQPLTTAALQLDFGLTGAFTGLPLRDSRLAHYFFQGDSGKVLRFTLAKAVAANGSVALPDVGMSASMTLSGTLAVAGVEAAVDVPVIVSVLPGQALRVTEGTQGAAYDLRSQWDVGAPLDALLALVGAKIDNHVGLRFSLTATDVCPAAG